MSEKYIVVKFTQKEISNIMECLETMLGMVGAMDDDFNREQKNGMQSVNRALKRSGYKYNRRDYSKLNNPKP